MELALFFGIGFVQTAGRAPTVAGGEMAASQVPAARRGDMAVTEESPHREVIVASSPVPAWLLSFMLHFAVVISLAFLLRAGTMTSAGSGFGDRGGEIVLIARSSDDKAEYLTEEDVAGGGDEGATEASESQNLAESLPDLASAPAIPGQGLPKAPSVSGGSQATTGAVSASGALRRLGPNAGRGGGAATSVFGAVGEGQRFVYVFDRSSSMAGGPIRAAKRELLTSLTHLGDLHQFGIVFYNHNQATFGSGGRGVQMFFAKKENRVLAERFVSSITAQGATNHLPALKLALDARPDVIFFLTDADEPRLTQRELAQIRQRNRGTTICTVEYGAGPKPPGVSFLEELAEQNGGQHRYVDVTQLPRR